MSLSKDALRILRADIDAALASVAKKHGLDMLRAGNATFDSTAGNFTFKLEGRIAGGLTKEQQRYDEGQWLGLPDRGTSFSDGKGITHTTWGLNSTGTKVITEASDGKRYNWPLAAIKAKFPNAHRPKSGTLDDIAGRPLEGPGR